MKKKRIIPVLLLLFWTMPEITAMAQHADRIMDEDSFLQKFAKAMNEKDTSKMEEAVSQGGPFTYKMVIAFTVVAIGYEAEGKDGSGHLDMAELIAMMYTKVFKKEDLLRLVRRYKLYDQEMCREKRKGDNLINEGLSLRQEGQTKEALEKWTEALKISDKLGDAPSKAKALAHIGFVYFKRGQYNEALKYCKQALEINRGIGDVADEAEDLMVVGHVYQLLGKYKKALNHYQQALEIDKRTWDVGGEVRFLISIGSIYHSIGQYNKALDYYQQALESNKKIDNMTDQAIILMNIGSIYYNIGQYTKALDYDQQALEISRKIADVDSESGALTSLAYVYRSIGQHSKALDYSQQALEISRRIGDAASEAKGLMMKGAVYGDYGQYSEELNYCQQALEISRRIGDVAGEVSALGAIGGYYYIVGQSAEALKYYKQALEIYRRIGDMAGEAKSLMMIGHVYSYLGQYMDAIPPLQESIRLSEQLGKIETLWKGHSGVGRSLWRLGKGEEAVRSYERAIETIEEIYSYTKGLKREERSSLIGKKSFVYKEFIALLLELHRKSSEKDYDKEAFTVSEKVKSRTFQELMAKAGARTVFAGDETFQKMVGKEQQLIGEVSKLHSLLTKELSRPKKEQSDEAINTINEELSKAEKSLGELEKEIETKYPRYADLKRPKPLGVEELQNILKPDETLLSYFVGKDKSAAFVIGKDRFKLIELELGREELAKLIKQFRKGLDSVSDYIDLTQFDPVIAYTLYQEIFQPLTHELSGVSLLYITADDILYTLPFEALVDHVVDRQAFEEAREKGKKGQAAYLGEYDTLHYLNDTYCITYLPSVSVLRSLRQYPKPGYGQWTKPLIAFADPIFSPEEKEQADEKEIKGKGISKETALTTQILTRSTGSNRLKRLEASAEEAKAIAKEVKGKVEDIYLREQATEENVYQSELKAARYLLFSTHGFLGGEFIGSVAEPALALTLVGNPPDRDGFLTMSEVLGLNLNAEVVMLSACNTYGRGEMAGSGEGFAGLTRSFMYAGTQSLLVTHWSVESQAARDLMVEAFRARKERSRLDEALRKAKLQMRKSTFAPIKDIPGWKVSRSHPYFWAPFVVVGVES